MESLQVRTGQISLRILDDNGDERGIFKFNPQDVALAKRVVDLQNEIAESQVDYEVKAAACTTDSDRVNLLVEVVDYYEGIIDKCFGEGTSKIVFGDAKSLSMFSDFLDGITPYYEKASKNRMAKYKKK